jgi:DNA-binding transcriptional ArsR family regulator
MPRHNGDGIALLADPTRRAIVAILAVRPTRPSALASRLGLSRPAVSRQLRLLAEADLIHAHPSLIDGRSVMYTVNIRLEGRILAWLAGTEVALETAPTRTARATRVTVSRRTPIHDDFAQTE